MYKREMFCRVFWSATGEKILVSYTAYIRDFTVILERRRRENFGKLHRLHKGFTVILERRRRENFGNLHRLHKGF